MLHQKLSELKSQHKERAVAEMKNAARQMEVKLVKLMLGDPARKLLQPVSELFYKQNLLSIDATESNLELLFDQVTTLKIYHLM